MPIPKTWRETNDKWLYKRRREWNEYERNGLLGDIASSTGDWSDSGDSDCDDDGDW